MIQRHLYSVLHKIRWKSVEHSQIDTDLRLNIETFEAQIENTGIKTSSPTSYTYNTSPKNY